jgi:hypothetical protein
LLGWLSFSNAVPGAPPAAYLAIYQPKRRTLDLIYIPAETRTESNRTLASIHAAALRGGAEPDPAADRLTEAAASYLAIRVPEYQVWPGLPIWRAAAPKGSDDPALDARDWLLRRSGGLFWPGILRRTRSPGTAGPGWSWLDRILLAAELQRLRPENVRPAWLPPEESIGPVFGRYLSPEPPDPASEHITVEVLNASARPGIASRAKNLLRLKGADVMSVGNTDAPRSRTMIYDRTGRFDNAAEVRRILGCPLARTVTQVDLKRLVDVSVVLAEDCPL